MDYLTRVLGVQRQNLEFQFFQTAVNGSPGTHVYMIIYIKRFYTK